MADHAAERAFASSVTGWREAGQLTLTAWGWYELVLLRRAQGRLDAAALTWSRPWPAWSRPAGRCPRPVRVTWAEIAYQRDELDSALRYATEGIALCRQFVYTVPLANGLATLAMIRQATGDPAGALEAITDAGQAYQLRWACSTRSGPAARLLLAQGDLAAAARFPQENGLGPDDEPDYAREPGYLALARVLLPRTGPARRSPCWTGCTPRRSPRTGPAA